MTDHCLKFRAGLALRFAGLELETQASGCLGLAVLQVLGFKFGGSHACDEQSGACKGAFLEHPFMSAGVDVALHVHV